VVLTNAYDAAGNRTSLSDSLGGVNSYTYDAWNELTGLAQSGTGVSGKGVTFSYDQAGRLTGLSRFSNASLNGTGAVLSTTYTYDQADRLTGITHALPNATVVASYAYTLDDADRLTSETRTWTNPGGGTSSDTLGYTYTDNNQLTGVTHTNTSFANESFSYDANGNRNMTGYSTGMGNELTSDGTYNYTYDNEGNQVTTTAIASGNETIYTHDFRNRLVEMDQVLSGVRSVVAQYTYDALDRRIRVSEGGAATWTAFDGSNPLLDFNGSGTQTARYLFEPAVDEILARETASSGTTWYLTDRLGTVRDLVGNSGAVIDHVDYAAFGNVLDESNPSAGDRFKFAGLEYDRTSGLNLAVNRAEDPVTGRWLTLDPIRFAGGDTNLNRYVENDPGSATDPSGLATPGWWKDYPKLKPHRGWWWNNPVVRDKCDRAWTASNPDDASAQHEEGGWIYWNPANNTFRVDPFPPGDPKQPGETGPLHMKPPPPNPSPGYIPVGLFHTHPPNIVAGSRCSSASGKDKKFSNHYNLPDLIISSPTIPGSTWRAKPFYPPGYPSRLR
jgi:RHS repeat-associated protein